MMAESRGRLEALNTVPRAITIGRRYSRFVKAMRLALPLAALALTVVVITWPEMEDKVAIIPKEDIIPKDETTLGQTELLNPHFETVDSNLQPVNVTAKRALQSQQNADLIRLEEPNAALKMEDGSDLNIKALQGTYEQLSEKLFLQNDVKIRHQNGYELQAEELRINMKTKEAFSDRNVTVDGPEARIEATGLSGNVDNGLLIFQGPATLTLTPKQTPKEEQKNAE